MIGGTKQIDDYTASLTGSFEDRHRQLTLPLYHKSVNPTKRSSYLKSKQTFGLGERFSFCQSKGKTKVEETHINFLNNGLDW